MGDMTKNLSRKEIACKCGCGFDTIDHETARILQETCNHYANVMGIKKVVVSIGSGCRCEDHNKAVGGGKNSQHLKGRAIDFTISGVNSELVYKYLNEKYPDQYGMGRYTSFTHFDSRPVKARW